MTIQLAGQWQGAQWHDTQRKNLKGTIMLNIEHINGEFRGRAILINGDERFPSFVANIKLTKNGNMIAGDLEIFIPIDPATKLPNTNLPFYSMYPNEKIPKQGKISCQYSNNALIGNYTDYLKNQATFSLNHSEVDKLSSYNPITISTWEDFVKLIQQYNSKTKNFIFRGQPVCKRLRTTYHRTGRCDLIRYYNENILELRRHICGYLD